MMIEVRGNQMFFHGLIFRSTAGWADVPGGTWSQCDSVRVFDPKVLGKRPLAA